MWFRENWLQNTSLLSRNVPKRFHFLKFLYAKFKEAQDAPCLFTLGHNFLCKASPQPPCMEPVILSASSRIQSATALIPFY